MLLQIARGALCRLQGPPVTLSSDSLCLWAHRSFPTQHQAVGFFQAGLQDFTPADQRCNSTCSILKVNVRSAMLWTLLRPIAVQVRHHLDAMVPAVPHRRCGASWQAFQKAFTPASFCSELFKQHEGTRVCCRCRGRAGMASQVCSRSEAGRPGHPEGEHLRLGFRGR